MVLIIGFHHIGACQILVCTEHTYQILALDIHKLRKPGTAADEDRIVAVFFNQIGKFAGAANKKVGLKLNSHGRQVIKLFLYNSLRQAEFGDTVDHYPAGLMEGLENCYLMPRLSEVRCGGNTRRSGAYYSYLLTGVGGNFRDRFFTGFALKVRHITLNTPYRNRFEGILEGLPHRTGGLALGLLRADPAANGRQQAALFDNLHRLVKIAGFGRFYKSGYIDGYRTALYAGCVFTVETAGRFDPHLVLKISGCNFVHIFYTRIRILVRHLLRGDLHAVFIFQLYTDYPFE